MFGKRHEVGHDEWVKWRNDNHRLDRVGSLAGGKLALTEGVRPQVSPGNLSISAAGTQPLPYHPVGAGAVSRRAFLTGAGATPLLLGGLGTVLPRPALAKTGYIAPSVIGTTPAIISQRGPGIVASNLAGLTATRRAQVKHMEAGPYIPPSTGPQNTIYEIYLDYLTAPGGSWGVAASCLLTTVYTGLALWGAYQTGYQIGTGVSWLLQNYAPTAWEAIGNGIGTVMDRLEAGSGYEEYMLSLEFNVPLANLMTTGGDIGPWGTMDLSADYFGGFDGGGGLCLNGC